MATEKKNQHYIPKFYLRNFSFKGNKKQIGIYNLNSSFFYSTAKLKTQGSQDFFYGYDGVIEDNLSKIEGVLASTIHEVIQESKIPKNDSDSYLNLLSFIALTHLRNPVAVAMVKGHSEKMRKLLLEDNPETDIDKFIPIVPHSEAIEIALSALNSVIDVISDLNCKLLINKTDKPFITSDFPVIKYNMFLEQRKWQFSMTGYGTVGLQIFLPLNSKYSLLFFDPRVYKVGFRKNNYITIEEENDIESLNILQVVNCFSTLFFDENASEKYIQQIVREGLRYQKANRPEVKHTYLLEKGEKMNPEKRKNLLVSGSTECKTNLNINGIKIHSNGKKIKLDSSVVQLRPRVKSMERFKR